MDLKGFSDSKWRERFFRFAPFLVWVAIIFYNSSSHASMNETSRFVRPLLEFLFPDAAEPALVLYHSYVRKLAHLAEYGMLAFFAARVFWKSKSAESRRYWHLWALGVVLLVASMDELNQSFDPTRTGSVYDVFIDFIGALIVICILIVYKRWRND